MNNNKEKFNINLKERKENGNIYEIEAIIPMNQGWIDNVNINIDNNQFPLQYIEKNEETARFKTEIFLHTKAIYKYNFNYKIEGIKKETKQQKISVNFEVPEWAKGKIMYHIFVDRFKKGRLEKLNPMSRRTIHKTWDEEMIIGPDKNGIWNADFYGGDLKGIIEELDYIKSLGVTILYLSPIVYSQSNHRYDTSDYENVDPYAGNNNDLKELCEKAHHKGMKIILDAVFNHTGNDSKYFNQYNTFNEIGAYQDKNSKYYPFYRTNNGNFDYWWGMTNLPVCDGNSKEWKDFILGENGIIDQWFRLGIDGLRLDVADELTDEYIEGIRTAVKRNKQDGFILGEVWKNPMRMNRSYIESGKGMDTVMNYNLIDALLRYFKYNDITKLKEKIHELQNDYPEDTINTLMNFTSTHDITRLINMLGSNEFSENQEWYWDVINQDLDYQKNFELTKEQYKQAKKILQAYIFTLTLMPGILSIFYGDEVGIQGLGNLSNRKTFPWGNEDNEIKEFFKYMGNIRKKEKFLETAELKIKDINYNYLMFERIKNNEKILAVINRTNEYQQIKLPEEYENKKETYSINNAKIKQLTPYGAIGIKQNRR